MENLFNTENVIFLLIIILIVGWGIFIAMKLKQEDFDESTSTDNPYYRGMKFPTDEELAMFDEDKPTVIYKIKP